MAGALSAGGGGGAGCDCCGVAGAGSVDCAVAGSARSATSVSPAALSNMFVPRVCICLYIISVSTPVNSTALGRCVSGNVSSNCGQECLQFPRQGALESNLLPRPRMDQFKLRCMKEISRERNRGTVVGGAAVSGSHLAWCAIERVAHDRITERGHVNADLVCPAGVDFYFD